MRIERVNIDEQLTAGLSIEDLRARVVELSKRVGQLELATATAVADVKKARKALRLMHGDYLQLYRTTSLGDDLHSCVHDILLDWARSLDDGEEASAARYP